MEKNNVILIPSVNIRLGKLALKKDVQNTLGRLLRNVDAYTAGSTIHLALK